MIYNYLKIAFRNLRKYKFISFINLFGLTVGMTCCLLILSFILHEVSYDRYNTKYDQIYRITRSFHNEQGVVGLHLSTISPPFGPLLKNDFGEIQTMTRLLPFGTIPMRYQEKAFNQKDVYFADEYLFDVFNVRVTKGDPKKSLADPYSMMLTEEMAEKYFGKDDPIDKVVRLDNNLLFKVTGIYKEFPSNSHMHPEILVSFKTLKDTAVYGEENLRTNWGNNSFFTYVVLPPHYNIKNMEGRFPAFLDKHMHFPGEPSNFKASKFTHLYLQKLGDIHLRSHLDYEAEENGDISRVYIFSAIALFILLIACINYMNLSTARSALRAREIGIRKVVGAERREIIFQFLSESIIIAWIAIVFAFALVWVALPALNKLSGQTLSINILLKWQIILSLVLVPFVVGTVSGIYPALFMSSFKPVTVLKGLFKAGGANISFRKILVVTQFSISIILIISTAIVFQQLRYMQKKDLGFDKEHIITLSYNSALTDRYEAFRNEMLVNPNVRLIGRSTRIPTGRLLDAQDTQVRSGDTMAPAKVDIKYVSTDQDFIPAYGVKVVAGRGFSRDFNTDTSSFVINEAAVKALGIKSNEKAVGTLIKYGGRKGNIVGVIADFHFESMHEKILPLILFIPESANAYGRLSIKISGNNIPAALSHIEGVWKKFLPETPFDYSFLDDNFDKLYQSEQRQATIFTLFACIAIFIACLGLFGLSSFAITQRIKEIGIRKVLGANISTIVGLLSKDFMKLVIIAAVLAFPVAWWAMSKWLQDFAYRISISWWIFLVAGIIAALVALATISFQAIKAAIANPVKSLRTE